MCSALLEKYYARAPAVLRGGRVAAISVKHVFAVAKFQIAVEANYRSRASANRASPVPAQMPGNASVER